MDPTDTSDGQWHRKFGNNSGFILVKWILGSYGQVVYISGKIAMRRGCHVAVCLQVLLCLFVAGPRIATVEDGPLVVQEMGHHSSPKLMYSLCPLSWSIVDSMPFCRCNLYDGWRLKYHSRTVLDSTAKLVCRWYYLSSKFMYSLWFVYILGTKVRIKFVSALSLSLSLSLSR